MKPAVSVLLPLLLGSLALLTHASTELDVEKLLAAGSAVGTFVFDRAAFDKQSSTAWVLHKAHQRKHAGGKHSGGSRHAGHHEHRHKGGEEDSYHKPHHDQAPPHEPHYHHHEHAPEAPDYGPGYEHHWDAYYSPEGYDGPDEPQQYPDSEYYPHQEHDEYYDGGPGSYGPPKQLCLQELFRTPNTFVLGGSGPWPTFTSYFGCCDSDYDDAPSVVGYCTLEGRQIYTPPIVDGQVGKVLGLCKFTAPAPCVPPRMLNQEFALSTLTNQTFWLEADAELRSNSSSYGDYDAAPYAVSTAAGASAGASAAAAADAKPAAAKPAYLYGDAHGPEYDVDSDPTGGPELLGRGKASVFTAMIASKAGLLKGGTFEFIAGFVDDAGEVLCPSGATQSTVSAPRVQPGTLPEVTCGEYKVKLWFAPDDHSYRGYDGYYHDSPPPEYYDNEPPYHYGGGGNPEY